MQIRMFLKKILLMSLLMLCTTLLWAVPAQRTTRLVEQPDGTMLVLMMRGDERFHYLVTADGVPVVRHEEAYYYALFGAEGFEASEYLAHDAEERTAEERAFVESLPDMQQAATAQMRRAAKRRAATRAAEPEVPTTGEVHVPILLVQYADVKFSSVKSQMEELANGENGTPENGTGSIRQFFVDQSEGQFLPVFDVIGPITLKNNMEYYGANDKEGNDLRPQEMAEEASKLAYAEFGVDFKRYDNNHDGYVDFLYIIYAGYGEASYPDMLENTIWPHQWELEKPLMLGGVNVQQYACNNELAGHRGNTLAGIGTFCHEFSHCLGLPDFYDTSSEGTAFGMSTWSIMDYGCYNNDGHTPCGYNAYEKDFIGWKLLVELKEPMYVTLKPLSEGGEACKIVNDANPNEFYVVEHVDQKGWHKYAPASGMMVLHVDYDEEVWYNNEVNNDPNHRHVTIIPADGKLDEQTLAGDVYPGATKNRSLTSTSCPAAKVYTGGYMNKDITDIVAENGATTFTFQQPEPQDRFTLDGATYRIVEAEQPSVAITASRWGNGDGEAYRGHYTFGESVRYGGADYRIVGIDKGAFRNAKNLRSVMVASSAMESVGDSLFHGCSALNAVVWDVPLDLPDKAFDADSYRNLLVYLPDTAKVPTSLDGMLHAAVVKDGYCEELTLDAESNFYCPRNFTAGHVAYSRTFKQTTGLGTSSGWETLVLPFDVQRITHATKGDITPFGIEGNAHCWLATPKDGAFTEATEIRANTPYILSMPNNDAYGDHSLAGSITFSAEEAEVHATPSSIALSAQAETTTVSFALVSTYDRVGASAEIYALNVGAKYGSFAPGSVFAPGRYDTLPFSAYMMLSKTQQAPPYYHIAVAPSDETGEVGDQSITGRDGYLYVESATERVVCLYDAVGRLVQVVRCAAGTTTVGPLDKGMYIMERTKIYVGL